METLKFLLSLPEVAAIICAVTGAIIRHFEKRKMKRNFEKEIKMYYKK